MRNRDEMLKDAGSARLRYAMLSNPSDMLVIRLAMDVTELLAALEKKEYLLNRQAEYVGAQRAEIKALKIMLARQDTEIERLKADLAQSRSAITKLSREIWKVC